MTRAKVGTLGGHGRPDVEGASPLLLPPPLLLLLLLLLVAAGAQKGGGGCKAAPSARGFWAGAAAHMRMLCGFSSAWLVACCN
jgi:hypothetical protein